MEEGGISADVMLLDVKKYVGEGLMKLRSVS